MFSSKPGISISSAPFESPISDFDENSFPRYSVSPTFQSHYIIIFMSNVTLIWHVILKKIRAIYQFDRSHLKQQFLMHPCYIYLSFCRQVYFQSRIYWEHKHCNYVILNLIVADFINYTLNDHQSRSIKYDLMDATRDSKSCLHVLVQFHQLLCHS